MAGTVNRDASDASPLARSGVLLLALAGVAAIFWSSRDPSAIEVRPPRIEVPLTRAGVFAGLRTPYLVLAVPPSGPTSLRLDETSEGPEVALALDLDHNGVATENECLATGQALVVDGERVRFVGLDGGGSTAVFERIE
ncbi:MAG: hypothetical protein AB7O52_14420 [Planctomycetota bacterium]